MKRIGTPRPPTAPRKRSHDATTSEPARGPAKTRATFHVPIALLEEARDAVVALSGPPVRLTLAHLVESALRWELERLRKVYHGGKPFPRYGGRLLGGRPIGS